MIKQTISIEFEEYNSINQLELADQKLLRQAIEATKLTYSPYSKFKVGVAAITNKGNLVTGSNQENVSYSVTICAERVVLSALSAQYPGEHVTTIAITCIDTNGINKLVTPCGVCRQALLEHEVVHKENIRIILGSENGEVYLIKKANDLLPLAFIS